MDLIKKKFIVIYFENKNRKVLISKTFPVEYSFILEISHGICSNHNWITWRVIQETVWEFNWLTNENKLNLNRYQNGKKKRVI